MPSLALFYSLMPFLVLVPYIPRPILFWLLNSFHECCNRNTWGIKTKSRESGGGGQYWWKLNNEVCVWWWSWWSQGSGMPPATPLFMGEEWSLSAVARCLSSPPYIISQNLSSTLTNLPVEITNPHPKKHKPQWILLLSLLTRKRVPPVI